MAMQAARLPDRAVLAVSGAEARDFLQGLVTNEMEGLEPGTARYAALLTPQGKILLEFLVYADGDENFLLDCASSRAGDLAKRLTLYRLRAKVVITARPDLAVAAIWGGAPPQAECIVFRDPRLPELGWRAIGAPASLGFAQDGAEAYRAHRIALGVPDSGDLPPDHIFALDAGFEELSGVSFKKGCYVGQEVTARMKHRSSARRRFVIATGGGTLPAGTPITASGKEIGTLGVSDGVRALAHVRLDRMADAASSGSLVEAQGHRIVLERPSWLKV